MAEMGVFVCAGHSGGNFLFADAEHRVGIPSGRVAHGLLLPADAPVSLFLAGKMSAIEFLRRAVLADSLPIHTAAAVAHRLLEPDAIPDENIVLGVMYQDAYLLVKHPEVRERFKLRNAGMTVAQDEVVRAEMWAQRFKKQSRRGLRVIAANEGGRRRADQGEGVSIQAFTQFASKTLRADGAVRHKRTSGTQMEELHALDGHWYNNSSSRWTLVQKKWFKIEKMQIVWQKHHRVQAWTLKREGEVSYSVCVNGTKHIATLQGASLVWGDGDVWVRKRELGARVLERRLEVLDALKGHVVFGRIPGEEYSYRALLCGDRQSGELQLLVNERCLPTGAPRCGAKGCEVVISLPSGDDRPAAAEGAHATYVLVQAVGIEELGRSDSLEQAFPLLSIESKAWAEAGLLKRTAKKIVRVLTGHFRLAASIFGKQRDMEDMQLLRQVADDSVGAQLPWHRQSNKYLQAYHLLKTSFANHPSLEGGEPQNFPTVVCDGRRGDDKCSVYDRVFSALRWRASVSGAAEGTVHPFASAILSKWRHDHDVDAFELIDAAALRPETHAPSRTATAAPTQTAAARRVLRVVRFEGAEEKRAAAELERALITTALKKDTFYERDGFVLLDARGAADPSAESLEFARRLGRDLLRAPEGADKEVKAMRSFRGFKRGTGSEDTYFCGSIRGTVNKLVLQRCKMPLYPMLCIDIPFGRLDCPNIAAGYNRCYGMARGAMARASVQGAATSYAALLRRDPVPAPLLRPDVPAGQ